MIYFVGNSSMIESEIYKQSTVEECLDYFKNHTYLQVDTETQGKDWNVKKILSLQIGDYENQWVIDVRVIDILKFKFLIESKICILQNAKFDYKFLKHSGIVLNKIYDTMLAECVIYCGYEKFGYGLLDITKRYLGVDLDKTTRGEFYKLKDEPFTDKQIEYASLDVKYLEQIKDKQQELITKYNLQYCVDLENEVVKALADIEYNGMYLNKDKWVQNTTDSQSKLFYLEKELDKIVLNDSILNKIYRQSGIQNLFGFEERQLNINYASPTQMKVIFSQLGYSVESTDDRELSKLVTKHDFFKILSEYRETAKIVSTYGMGFLDYINPNTNRVHTSFWQVLNTGRVSSGSKDDNAPNLQNIPADNKFRNCFEARPGFKWVSIDYSGQELNLMADGSGEQGFIDVLNRGEDLHCYAGSMMFKKPVTKADKELRNKAKTINFGKPYGMGVNKLADTLSISIEEAEGLFREYSTAFPVLNKWLENQGKFAKQNMYSLSFKPCERRRWFPEMKEVKNLREHKDEYTDTKAFWKKVLTIEGQTERNGMNMPIQASGADITKEALVGVRNLIEDYNRPFDTPVACLICTVHDAIDVEVEESLAEEFANKMSQIMIDCGNKYVSKVKMRVDVTITNVWQK